MHDLKVTLIQANQIWEDKTANFKNYESLIEGVDADLILLPEMFQTGFTMNANQHAEDWKVSDSVKWLQRMAAKHQAAIYTSLMINDNGTFNRGVFVHPDGKVDKYDKRKTFKLAKEHLTFSSGKDETIVQYKGWYIQLQICYDLRFPEIVRNRIVQDQNAAYDVILYVANWPEKRAEHWRSLLKARAIENQCYVAGVNRVGTDKNQLNYSGNSAIVNALGEVNEMKPNVELTQTFVLKKNELSKIREMLPFLGDQ